MQSLLAFVIYKCGDKCHSTGATWRYEAPRFRRPTALDYSLAIGIMSTASANTMRVLC